MKVTMGMIADEANISQGGKLNVLGVFDRIAASTYPTVHPKLVFVFRMEAEFGDGGSATPVRVRLIDEDGGTLFEAGGEVRAPAVQPGEAAGAYQIFPLMGVTFPRPGSYKFVVEVENQSPYESPLTLLEAGWSPERTARAN